MWHMSGGVLAWLSVCSELQIICIWFNWCHLNISCFIKIQTGLSFWCQLTQVVLDKRPLNGCSLTCGTGIFISWMACSSCHPTL